MAAGKLGDNLRPMAGKIRGRLTFANGLTFANVMSALALFVALGGTSYAALTITGRNVKNNSLTGKDIKDGSIALADLNPAARGGKGTAQKGDQGPPGAKGSDAQFSGTIAGGDLTGTFPNPTIVNGAVTPAKLGVVPAARVSGPGDAGNLCNALIQDNTLTAVSWGTEQFDTANLHSGTCPAASSSKLVAPIAGLYAVGGGAQWHSNAAGLRAIYVGVNGTTFPASQVGPNDAGTFVVEQSVATVVKLNAGDYVELFLKQRPLAAPLARSTMARMLETASG